MPDMPGPPAHEGGSFLMKKFGPLPIAAYVVAGAALVGILLMRNRSAGSRTSPGSVEAPVGINDPTTDQNAALYDTLNALETQMVDVRNQLSNRNQPDPTPTPTPAATSGAAIGQWYNVIRRRLPSPPVAAVAPESTAARHWPVPTRWIGNPPVEGAGGAEAPMRILPPTFMRTPVHLNVEMTPRGEGTN